MDLIQLLRLYAMKLEMVLLYSDIPFFHLEVCFGEKNSNSGSLTSPSGLIGSKCKLDVRRYLASSACPEKVDSRRWYMFCGHTKL